MRKSIFTILLLIVALLVVGKIKSFVENNRPVEVPITTLPTEIEFPEGFDISTSTEIELQLQATSTLDVAM
jgi:hypothetical protein